LYTRSQIVVAAKTFGLDAIDMVGDEPKPLGYPLNAYRRCVSTTKMMNT